MAKKTRHEACAPPCLLMARVMTPLLWTADSSPVQGMAAALTNLLDLAWMRNLLLGYFFTRLSIAQLVKESACHAKTPVRFWAGRSTVENRGYPLSILNSLEKSMDWIVHGYAKVGHNWVTFLTFYNFVYYWQFDQRQVPSLSGLSPSLKISTMSLNSFQLQGCLLVLAHSGFTYWNDIYLLNGNFNSPFPSNGTLIIEHIFAFL